MIRKVYKVWLLKINTMEFDKSGKIILLKPSKEWVKERKIMESEAKAREEKIKAKKLAKIKEHDDWLNKQTKPWTNSGKAYTDKDFRVVIDGNSDDEKEIIKVGKHFKRKATAIRELRKFRNRYINTGEIPPNFWGQSVSKGPHDLPDKPDHNGRQLKRVIDEMPDYYKGFT